MRFTQNVGLHSNILRCNKSIVVFKNLPPYYSSGILTNNIKIFSKFEAFRLVHYDLLTKIDQSELSNYYTL